MKNKSLTYLYKRLDNLFEDQTFEEWCENIIDDITINVIPVDLRDIFPKRKIIDIRIDNSLLFPAKIQKKENSFVIVLNKRTNWSSSSEYRFYVAHEIAHTFQYKIINDVSVEQTYFLPGTYELEYFCNRIARTILMPRKLLIPFLSEFDSLNDNHFSIKFLNELSTRFNVDHKVTLQRIIHDIDYFGNLILLRFIKLSGIQTWGLIERYLSNVYNNDKKFFIPYMNKDKSKELVSRLPSCSSKLNSILDEFERELEFGKETRLEIQSYLLNEKPLKTFMNNFKDKKFNVARLSKVKSGNDLIINILISLDDKHVVQHAI